MFYDDGSSCPPPGLANPKFVNPRLAPWAAVFRRFAACVLCHAALLRIFLNRAASGWDLAFFWALTLDGVGESVKRLVGARR